MGIASLSIESIRQSAALAARTQWAQLEDIRLDVGSLEVHSLPSEVGEIDTVGIVAADAGLVSVILSPFCLDFLHVADHKGIVHLAEFFPLTTLAEDLQAIFKRAPVLREFSRRLQMDWAEMTDLWKRNSANQPPMPREVHLVAETLREIAEWAVAMELAAKEFDASQPPSTPVRRLVLHDGMLRSILLRNEVINERLPRWWRDTAWKQRRIAIAGVGKSSIIWQRLALALSMDPRVRGIPQCWIRIPEVWEQKIFRRLMTGERLGFGHLVLLKSRPDSMGYFLPLDLPEWILDDPAATECVLAQIVRVSRTTFPRPGYPGPLERAHEAAHLTEFDAKIIRDQLLEALREMVPKEEYERMRRAWAFNPERWEKSARIGRL